MGNGLSNNARLADGSQPTAVNELKMIGKVNSFYPGHLRPSACLNHAAREHATCAEISGEIRRTVNLGRAK